MHILDTVLGKDYDDKDKNMPQYIPWEEIEQHESYGTLSPVDQKRAKEGWFKENIAGHDSYTKLSEQDRGTIYNNFLSSVPEAREVEAPVKREEGFARGLMRDIGGGLADLGEMYGRGIRALPGGAEAGVGEGVGGAIIGGAQKIKERHDLEPKERTGLSRWIHGGIRAATTSLAAGAPGVLAGIAATSWIPIPGARVLGAIAGYALGGATLFGVAEYDSTLEEALKAGVDPEKAEPAAIRNGLYEGGFEFAANILEGVTMGAGRIITRPAKEALKEGVKSLFKIGAKQAIKRGAGVAAIETGSEMLTAGLQTEEYRKLGLTKQRFYDAAKEAFGPAFVASLIFGGVAEGGLQLNRKRLEKVLKDPNSKPEERLAVAKEVYSKISEVDQELAEQWKESALDAIATGETILTDEALGSDTELETEIESREKEAEKLYDQEQQAAEKGAKEPDTEKKSDARKILDRDEIEAGKSAKDILTAEDLEEAEGEGVVTAYDDEALDDMIAQGEKGEKIPEKGTLSIDDQAHEAATSPMNDTPEPTEAQKEAGNYKKGHIAVQGLDIAIENPEGSERTGVSPDGKKWSTTMVGHYGYFKRTEGKDGDQVDVFVKPGERKEDHNAYVVDQVDPETRKFDEHKVMLGYPSLEKAKEGYLANYEKGWQGLGNITEVPIDELKAWMEGGKRTEPYKKDRRKADVTRKSFEKLLKETKDIEEARSLARQMADTAYTDPLMGIGNKASYLEAEIAEENLPDDKKSHKTMYDIDNFSWVNDVAGHGFGDDILKQFGKILQEEGINPHRFGGEEIVDYGDDAEKLRLTSEQISSKLDKEVEIDFELKQDITLDSGAVYKKGERIILKGIGVSYGSGKTRNEADQQLLAEKQRKTKAGLRAAKGGEPKRVHRQFPEGYRSEEGFEVPGGKKGERVSVEGIIDYAKKLLTDKFTSESQRSALQEHLEYAEKGNPYPLADYIASLQASVKKPADKSKKHLLKGKQETVYLPDNTPVKIQYTVTDINDLIPSHTTDLVKRPDFPQELQPRDRDRKSMRLQISNIASQLNPELLGADKGVTKGAPIVGSDMVVESGNGRVLAIRVAYDSENGKKYKDWLVQNAGKSFGVDASGVENIKMPILVRERLTQTDRVEFAKKANRAEIASMSPLEQAKSDAGMLTKGDIDIFIPGEDGNINAASNKAFRNRFLTKIGKEESAQYYTEDGSHTKALIDRIQAAIFYTAYESPKLTSLIAEEADPNIKVILNSLNFAATEFAKARGIDPKLDGIEINSVIIEAAEVIKKARGTGESVTTVLSQTEMFEKRSKEAETLAKFFDENKRSATKIGTALKKMGRNVKEYLSGKDQAALPGFTKAKLTVAEIIQGAIEEKQKDLFGGEAEATTVTEDLPPKTPKTKDVEKEKPVKTEGSTVPPDIGEPGNFNIPNLARYFLDVVVKTGEKLNKVGVQTKVAEKLGITKSELVKNIKYSHKPVEEAFEYAVVMRGREIIEKGRKDGRSVEEIYDELKGLYESQPLMGTRTSTSMKNQAYSTPIHLAYLTQVFAGVNSKTSVYEPSAGTGMLLTAASPGNTTANEIDKNRVDILIDQGFTVKEYDGTSAVRNFPDIKNKSFDAVVANPPFGPIAPIKVNGYLIDKIEHKIVADALLAMKDNGKAAFIIGGHNFDKGKMANNQRVFLNWLYSHYNVTHNIDIPGKEYARQGASFPVRLIVVDGRVESPDKFAPMTENGYQSVESIDEVRRYADGTISSVDTSGTGKISPDEAASGGIDTGGQKNDSGQLSDLARPESGRPDRTGGEPGRDTGQPPGEGLPGGMDAGESDATGLQGDDGDRHTGEPAGTHGSDTAPAERDNVRGGKKVSGPGEGRPGESAGVPGGTEGVDLLGLSGVDSIVEQLLELSSQEAEKAKIREEKEGKAQVQNAIDNINDILSGKTSEVIKEGGKDYEAATIADDNPVWLKLEKHFNEIWDGLGRTAKDTKDQASLFISEAYSKIDSKGKPYIDKFINTHIRSELEKDQQEKQGKAETPPKTPKTTQPPTEIESDEYQITYAPKSKGNIVDETLMPRKMYETVLDALNTLEAEVGDIDEYVTKKLGYKNTGETYKHLSADQIDAVAMAIHNVDNGEGMIIGDQTGVGKGRCAAAVLDYAKSLGKKPVFFTEKPNLFTDLYRDIIDIGKALNPFIMASDEKLATILDENGQPVYTPDKTGRNQNLKRIRTKGVGAINEHDSTVATYSQINKPNLAQEAINSLAGENIIVLDESHNASGASEQGRFITSILQRAKAVLYLSATFAKRPDTMPVYFRTALSKSNLQMKELVTAIERGGTPLQEIVTNALAKVGQYIRREKSFKGIDIVSEFDTKNKQRDAGRLNEVSGSLRSIVAFDKKITAFVAKINEDVKTGNAPSTLFGVNMPGAIIVGGEQVSASVTTSNFASTVHNAVRQSLLSMKADMAVERAEKELKAGRKPIIALANTMGSFLKDQVNSGLLQVGGPLDLSLKNVMERHLRRTLQLKIKSPKGKKDDRKVEIPVKSLPEDLQEAYRRVEEQIGKMGEELTGNPIDYIKARLMEKGYSVGELTARKYVADLSSTKKPILKSRSGEEVSSRNKIVGDFNNGKTDCLVVNAAGATGISLHSSPKFKDKRPRVYLGLQAELNIDTEVQKMGRINRKGQIELPGYQLLYLDLPTEIRPAAVLTRKLKSLSANTSAGADSPLAQRELPDMMNKYGDHVTTQWIEDNPGYAYAMGVKRGDNMEKVTGRLALQPLQIQEQFYEDVEQEYLAHIENLKEEGRYDLEVGEVDYRAETISKELLTQGKDESNPLGASSYREKLTVTLPRKPYNKKRIEKLVKDRLAGKTSEEVQAELISEIESQTEKYLNEKEKAISSAEELQRLKDGVSRSLYITKDKIDDYQIGRKYQIYGSNMGDEVWAVLLEVKISKGGGNPSAPSRIKLAFAVNNALQKYTLPLSKVGKGGHKGSVNAYALDDSFYEDNWDESISGTATQTRYMITGNLLQGYADATAGSRIVRFTTKEGPVREGILLPFNYNPDAQDDKVRITEKQIIKAVEATDVLYGAETTLRKDKQGSYSLFVPKSKKLGSKYFFDEVLLSHVAGEFESKSGMMRAAVRKSELPAVVKRLYELGEAYSLDRTNYDHIFKPEGGEVREKVEHYQLSAKEARARFKFKPSSSIQAELDFSRAQIQIPFGKKKSSPASNAIPKGRRSRVRMATTGYIAASGNIVRSPEDAAALLAPIRKSAQELIYGITTDENGVVLEIHEYAKGTARSVNYHTHELIGHVLTMPSAKKFYLTHNHPAGTTEPSEDDTLFSYQVKEILDFNDIESHSLIIGGMNWAEFGATGPESSYFTNPRPLRPTVRMRAKLPVKGRVIREHKATKASASNSSMAAAIFKKQFDDKDGFLFLDGQNRVAGFAPYPVGMGAKKAAAVIISELNKSGGLSMIFNSPSQDVFKSGRIDFLQNLLSTLPNQAYLFDILNEGRSLADTGRLPPVLYTEEANVRQRMKEYSTAFANLEKLPPLYKKRNTKTAAGKLQKDDLQKEIDKITDRWENAPKVVVWQSQNDMLDNVFVAEDFEGDIGDGDIIDGLYYRGAVHLVADNLGSINSAIDALVHEAFGHYGIEKTIGKDARKIYRDIYIAKHSEIKKIADEYGYDLKGEMGRTLAADEWLAREAENHPNSGWVKRIYQAIRDFFAKIMPDGDVISDAQIRQYLKAARDYVVKGPAVNVSDGLGAFFGVPGYQYADQKAQGQDQGDAKFSEGIQDSSGISDLTPAKEPAKFSKRKRNTKQIDTTGYLPPRVEKRMAAAKLPGTTWAEDISAHWTEIKRQRQHFPDLQTIEDKPLLHKVNDILRRHQEIPETTKNKTIQIIQSFTENLSKDGYKIYRMNIILADMMRDIKNGLTYDGKLPFGFEKTSEVEDAYAKYKEAASGNPEIAEALKKRSGFINDIKRKLVKAKLLKKEVLRDDDYFHHQIIQYWEKKYGLSTGSSDVRTHWRPWMAARKGSPLDYNTDYIEAEFTAISQQLSQLEVVETLKRIKKEANIYGKLRQDAKDKNIENLWKLLRAQGKIEIHEKTGKEIDPLLPWKQKIAMSNINLAKMAASGELEHDSEWQEIVDALANSYESWKANKNDIPDWPLPGVSDPRWFHFLSYIIDKKKPGANWAATVFKAIRARDKYIEETLGEKFLTYENMIPKGWVAWKPDPKKGWFWANVVTDKVLEKMQVGLINPNDVEARKLLAKGRDEIWVIPEGLAKTMDDIRGKQGDPAWIGNVADTAMRSWKQYILMNPYSVIRYNLNNTSGDLDATLAYAPEISKKYAFQAFKDLWKWHRRKKLDPKVQAELDKAQAQGALSSGFSVQEVSDVYEVLSMDRFVKDIILDENPNWFTKAEWYGVKRAGIEYWKFVRMITAMRENTLRLAAYRFFKDNSDKRLYGASKIEEVDAIKDPDEKAAKLSRELLGDYGNISRSGEWMRKRLMPFYSWMEINTPRYVYLMRNTKYENRDVDSIKKQMTAVAGKKLILAGGKMALRASMLMGAVILWNMTVFPDEEEELGESGRRQMHLVLGRREDGTIITLRFQGALSDALSFFGLEDWPSDMKDVLSGKRTVGDKLKEAPVSLLNRGVQAIRPEVKMFGEMISKKSFYPDVTSPGPIRDRIEHVLRTFKLDRIYKEVTGKPRRGGNTVAEHLWNDLESLFVYNNDPGIQAYYDTRKMVFDWLAEQGDEKSYGSPTKRGNALYYYKQALKYGDLKAAEKYLQKYYDLSEKAGKDPVRGKQQSIKLANPLASVPSLKKREFRLSLTQKQNDAVVRAWAWYNKTYTPQKHGLFFPEQYMFKKKE